MCEPAAFAASVTITPTAAGTYTIHGDSMDGVAGIDLSIIYDNTSLSSPTVSQGSLVAGAMLAAGTSNPGTIKIVIISTKAFSGSGEIATVTFATQSGTKGITSASVSMINSKGAPISAQTVISGGSAPPAATPGFTTTAGVPFSPSPASTAGVSPVAAPSVSSIPTQPGTVNLPSDFQAASDAKTAAIAGAPVSTTGPAAANPVEVPAEVKQPAESHKPEAVTSTSYRGVLENFREYKGERSPAAIVALFTKEITSTIRQEPAVALSDGKTPLNILIKLESAGDKSPNISLNGAKLVSLSRDASFNWVIVALPQAGTVQASLTVLTDSELIEYPLTLAPPAEGVSAIEADFAGFLSDSGALPPKRDLNGDGRHDYLDDFIYTAHYLKKKSAAGKNDK